MGELVQAVLVLLAGAGTAWFALRWKREGVHRDLIARAGRFGKDCFEAIARESEATARVAIVKWGVAGVLGTASIITGGVVANNLAPRFAPVVEQFVGGSVRRENDIRISTAENEQAEADDGAVASDAADGVQDGTQATGDEAVASDAVVGTMPAAGTLDWFCDWSAGTGTTFTAVRGTASTGSGLAECFGDKTGASNDLLAVVAKPGGGCTWPSELTNVLAVKITDPAEMGGSGANNLVLAPEVIDAPAVGEYVYIRTYDCNQMAEGDQTNTHILHFGSGGGCVGGNGCYSGRLFADATSVDAGALSQVVQPMFGIEDAGPGAGRFRQDFDVGETFRREYRVHRVATDSAKMDIRVYNAAGTLILESADFICEGESDAGGCTTYGADGDPIGMHPFRIFDADRLRGIEVGNNGVGANDDTGGNERWWYWGAFAMRLSTSANDWIGAYPTDTEAP